MQAMLRGAPVPGTRRNTFTQKLLASLSVIVMSLGLATVFAASAQAATPGITVDVLHKGKPVTDNAAVPEGDDLLLRVQYDAKQDIAGKQIVFTFPESITLPGTLPANSALESLVRNPDGTVTATFKDPIPSDVTEGAFAINLKAGQVDKDTDAPISWKIGDDEGGIKLVIDHEEPVVVPPTPIADGYAKGVAPRQPEQFCRDQWCAKL